MSSFSIDEVLEMQKTLQERYKGRWEPIGPETGKNKLLWMVGEVGEVTEIIKKNGHERIMGDDAVRAHFVEEMADVLMYYGDVMNCFSITADELAEACRAKFRRNLERW